MPKRNKIWGLFLIYLSFFGIGMFLVWQNVPRSVGFTLYDFGKILGVWGLTALSFQFVLSSRSKLLERGVGLDRIMRFHSFNAKLLFFSVLLHPLFLGVLTRFKVYTIFHWLGFGALILLIGVLVTTIYSSLFKINYEFWKVLHKAGYVILTLAFVHSFFLGTDILSRSPVFYWQIFLLGLIGVGIISRQLHRRFAYEVVEVKKENAQVRTIVLKPQEIGISDHLPGQFAFVRFLGDISSEEHHFTISSAPGEKYLTFSVKELGDFTAELGKLKPGDRAIIDGPYGVFTNYEKEGPFLFISGGIGITPIASMLRYMSQKGIRKDSILIYTVKEKKDLVFAREFEKISREGWLTIIYRFTEKQGHLDTQALRKVKRLKRRAIYLVGPGPMVGGTLDLLSQLGVKKSQINTEMFALR